MTRPTERLRRRVYLVALATVGPLVPLFGYLRADEPFALPVYSTLTVALLGAFLGLLTGRLSVAHAELLVVISVPGIVLARLAAVTLVEPLPLAELRVLTTESIGPTLMAAMLIVYLALDVGRARWLALGLWAAFTALLVPSAARGDVELAVALGRQSATLAAVAGLAYALASLKSQLAEERAHVQALHEIASTDALTGARNRRGVESALREQLDRVQRYGGTFSVALVDLDRFKDCNDHHGHAAGDAALVAVVAALQRQLRASDVLGRWGGDELLIVVPATPADEAWHSAVRWRAAIADLDLTAGPGRVTASVGVATYAPEDDADTLLIRADRALYAAKRAGGDQVLVDAGTTPDAWVAARDGMTPTA